MSRIILVDNNDAPMTNGDGEVLYFTGEYPALEFAMWHEEYFTYDKRTYRPWLTERTDLNFEARPTA